MYLYYIKTIYNMTCNKDIFWLYDPKILSDNFTEFVPTSSMSRTEQLNSLTRLAIYFIIILLAFNKSSTWILTVIFFIVFLTFLYITFKYDKEGMKNEVFRMRGIDINGFGDEDYNEDGKEYQEPVVIETAYYDSNNNLVVNKYNDRKTKALNRNKKLKLSLDDYTNYEKSLCKMPTSDNPFMNPLLNDISLGPDEAPLAANADDEDIKDKIIECYNEGLYRDIEDLFEKHNSQRQFYTVPRMYPNDQSSFANWLYKTDDICKVDQSKCMKYEDLRHKRLGQNHN